jgi:hypothetical protein
VRKVSGGAADPSVVAGAWEREVVTLGIPQSQRGCCVYKSSNNCSLNQVVPKFKRTYFIVSPKFMCTRGFVENTQGPHESGRLNTLGQLEEGQKRRDFSVMGD